MGESGDKLWEVTWVGRRFGQNPDLIVLGGLDHERTTSGHVLSGATAV